MLPAVVQVVARSYRRSAFVVALLALLATLARAQSSATPYGWLSQLDGTVGVGPLSTQVDLSVRDILRALKFGAMAAGEVHHGAWLVSADAIYVSLKAAKAVAVRGDTGTFTLKLRETILQPALGYGVTRSAWSGDLQLGARYWNLSSDLDVDRTRRPGTRTRSGSRDWVDAIGIARGRWRVAQRVQLAAGVDAGGGGARSTWQTFGAVVVDACAKVGIDVAYRYLAVDYDRRGFVYDVHMNGALVGATIRF